MTLDGAGHEPLQVMGYPSPATSRCGYIWGYLQQHVARAVLDNNFPDKEKMQLQNRNILWFIYNQVLPVNTWSSTTNLST
jgi:hypothetical protein